MTTTTTTHTGKTMPKKSATPVSKPTASATKIQTTIYDSVLYDYQKEAADRIATQRRLLLADQPGLGKTLEVVGGLERLGMFQGGKVILILTPIINARTAWIDTIKTFVLPRYDVEVVDISQGTGKQKQKAVDALKNDGRSIIIVANHNAIDLVKTDLRVPGVRQFAYHAVVIDESHMVLPIRNSGGLTLFWRGLNKIHHQPDSVRIAVSGTPDRGKLENRYGTWAFLDPWGTPPNQWSWLDKNFVMYEQRVARNRTVKAIGPLRDKNGWVRMDATWMLRRTKNEVLKELPPKRYVDVELDLTPQQELAYLGLMQNVGADATEEDSIDAMVYAIRARQIVDCTWDQSGKQWQPIMGSPSCKLDWLQEFFESRGFFNDDDLAGNSKVVIASQFSAVLYWLQQELMSRGIKAQVLSGSTPNNQREAIQKEFQEKHSSLRVVLLSGAMGVGITLDAADDLIMFDSPYDPDRIEQIEDRVHRASNMHNVTIWNLIGKGTIDQAIMETVSKRYATTRMLLDGVRGIDFERKILAKISKNVSDQ